MIQQINLDQTRLGTMALRGLSDRAPRVRSSARRSTAMGFPATGNSS